MPSSSTLSIPAGLKTIRADVFRLNGKSPEDAFVITLALAYNDLRMTLWMQKLLADSTAVRDKDPEGRAEWRGLLLHAQRLQVGIVNEILEALKKASDKGIFKSVFWRHAIEEMQYRTPAAL